MFTDIFHKISKRWKEFIKELLKYADREDKSQIFFKDFLKVLANFKIKLSESQQKNMLLSFPGRDEGSHRRVNIGRIYD